MIMQEQSETGLSDVQQANKKDMVIKKLRVLKCESRTSLYAGTI